MSTFLRFAERASDSPFVERVWHCRSERADKFISIAGRAGRWSSRDCMA